MKEIICDICKKRIEPKDIPVEIDLRIGDKLETIDMHSLCYYKFMRELKSLTDEEDERLSAGI